MRSMFSCFILLASFNLAFGCSPKTESETSPVPNQEIIEGIGTIVHMDLEGGFYAIRSDGGATYDPQSLSDDFKTDGLRVRFKVRVVPGAFGIHQVGPIVEVLSIGRLK